MNRIIIHNGTIVNQGRSFIGWIAIEGDMIQNVGEGDYPKEVAYSDCQFIDAQRGYILPGVIDDQVHFREPGLTHKGTIKSESKAALSGGITSFMEMPNTNPPTITIDDLNRKFDIAECDSSVNYSFYMGASNNNFSEIEKVDSRNVCGLKVFMGSSTGNMLVDNSEALCRIFASSPLLVAVHCEQEEIVRHNLAMAKERYGDDIHVSMHPMIRNAEACYRSSAHAVELAERYGTRLHVLHVSTEKEMSLFSSVPLSEKRITSEVCVHHLWFTDADYAVKGNFIKWNPAIKSFADRDALRKSLINGKIDIVATDHAPHTTEEKNRPYLEAPSGGPLVQHSLAAMLEMCDKGIFTIEKVIEKMCHAPAELFNVDRRGFLKKGYFADIVIVKKEKWEVSKDNVLSKCGWSPFEHTVFSNRVTDVFINGNIGMRNGVINDSIRGQRLKFNR